MSRRLLQWDGPDPLVDNLYCQVPFSRDDHLSKSAIRAIHAIDEPTVHRYEVVARQYLAGRAPLLITAALQGPFDRASGWVNPWATTAAASPPSTQQSASTSASLRKARSPALCEASTSPLRNITQTIDSSCHLPSPESLLADAHPFLEKDEVAALEKWREGVQSNVLARDEFWASTSHSAAKRPREDSSWLKRRAEKRPRAQEPEPKLSSPVSVADKTFPDQGASSPLSTLTSLSNGTTPLQRVERPKTEASVRSQLSTIARAPQRSSSSVSRRASPRQKLPFGSEALRGSNDSSRFADNGSSRAGWRSAGSFKYTINRTSSRHTASVRRSSPAVKPETSSVSSDDSSLSSSPSQSSHGGHVPVKQEPDNIPITSDDSITAVQTHEVRKEESPPQEDRILQTINANANATPKAETGRPQDTPDIEDAVSSAAKLAHKVLFCEDFDPIGYNQHIQSVASRVSDSIASGTPLANSPCPAPPGADDNPSVLPQVDGVGEIGDGVTESTSSTPDTAAVYTPACSPSVPASSSAGVASASAVEGDVLDDATGVEQRPAEHEQPREPVHLEALNSYPSDDADRATPQDENQSPSTEAFPTSIVSHHTEDIQPSPGISQLGTPSQRLATQQQSPWMHDPISSAINVTPGEPSRPCDGTRGDQQSQQSVAVSPEAQSPWMTIRLPSQPQENNNISSNRSSPQLPPSSQGAPEPSPAIVKADHSALLSDTSYTDFSIKSFSSFMSPPRKHRSIPLISDNHIPRTPSLLTSMTRNPWQTTSSKSKKRVSWAPLPHEADTEWDTPVPTPSFSRASPPPAHPVPDDFEEGTDVFRKHFVTVKRRTDPIRQRLLPTASQQVQLSPETDAMARAFATADGLPAESQEPRELTAAKTEVKAEMAMEGGGDGPDACDGSVDDVDDVLENLNEFLTSWDVDADLEKARTDGLAPRHGSSPARTSALRDVEIGGW